MFPVPLPKNRWGVLECLVDTPWATSIPTVSKTGLDHALHGYVTPEFVREMGTAPFVQGRKVPDMWGYCREYQSRLCAMRTARCRPGKSPTDPPECYRSPGDEPISRYTTAIVRAWAEGRYVFVVDEEK